MRALCLFMTIWLWTGASLAGPADGKDTRKFTLEKGRVVVVEMRKPLNTKLPTLLFLPGLDEKIPLSHATLGALSDQGFGVVSMSFSTHPPSVAALGADEVPFFRIRPFTVQDFAWEVEELAKVLRKRKGFKDLIPVSLSFSAAPSAYLRSFPLIIETVPLTSSESANPKGENYRALLKNFNAFNFFGGAEAVRRGMDASYRNFWSSEVDEDLRENGWPENRREDMLEGYLSMSRAVEGFDVEAVDLPKNVERLFLIAGKEDLLMKRHQIETVQRLQKAGYRVSMEELIEAEHLIMRTKDGYVAAIAKAALNFNCQQSLKAR